MRRSTAIGVVALSLASGAAAQTACKSSEQKGTQSPATAAAVRTLEDRRPVEPGTTFAATLEDSIGTATSRDGDRFELRVDEDVRGGDGRVVIRSGAKLEGQVVRVESDEGPTTLRFPSPRLWLKLESIDGRPVSATVVDAAGYAEVSLAGPGEYHDAILLPKNGAPAAIGGGPPAGTPYDGTSKPQVRLPEGAKLQLMIRAPLR